MLVPISKLKKHIVTAVVMAVEESRAELAGKHNLSTEEPEISFTVDVYDDTLGYVDGDLQESITPDTTTEVTKGEDTQTQTQEAVTTTETQTTTPGDERSEQAFGRSTETVTEETT